MKYILFTGATGLLGEYLLRDGLSRGQRFAVLVRPGKMETARGRVESILARIETVQGVTLPRPVILEGNLHQPELGLSPEHQHWVSENCDRILHNAASLIFYTDEKTGEPARSNIDGTRNVLEIAEKTGIHNFFHVSTAYVCGFRNDLCLESQLDVGQNFGNDYERSKVTAEKMVRSTGFLKSLTVFRPAIIIGDSKTGYTSTYHGFFTPLKSAHVMAANANLSVVDGSPLLNALGLTGAERKNFVPVDWVSEIMTQVMLRQETWGTTYHLVPRNRTDTATTTKVFEEAIKRFYASKTEKKNSGKTLSLPAWASIQELFRTQVSVYRSYWRDDPEFDYSNVTRIAPEHPCPFVDFEMLLRMAMFALESGFGFPVKQPVPPKIDVQEIMNRFPPADVVSPVFGLQVNGRGGGQWTLTVKDNNNGYLSLGCRNGLPAKESPLIYLNSTTFENLNNGTQNTKTALESGAVSIQTGGQPISVQDVEKMMTALFNRTEK